MKTKKTFSRLLIIFMATLLVVSVPLKEVYADAYKVVTLGGDLTENQKKDMLKYFGVDENTANIIEVNIDEERKYLEGTASIDKIGTKSISCSYIEPTSSGGLNVTVNNVYWVTDDMIKNALITAGIKNANVKVSAPIKVSGTAALTGILKGFENSSGGSKIDENKKEVANEELSTTAELGDKIGKDEAAKVINDIKTQVIKDKPKTEEAVKNIVLNVINNYNLNLSNEDIDKITALMNKINGLNLNFADIKDQLNQVSNQLKEVLSSEETKSFFTKLIDAIKSFFSKIFG
ncbi:DUF1002 domain-containing protein [Clostridium prolinivorans]|uniref:DUF1002 domain-containing protein n=1 Tax=Clostridium prolinivorans TaxID=2769420 RepID=UPI000FD81616|nr:DUF1002 domain-containing protein [Clostridium prolinivorans]